MDLITAVRRLVGASSRWSLGGGGSVFFRSVPWANETKKRGKKEKKRGKIRKA